MIEQYMPLIVVWLVLSFIYTLSHVGESLQRPETPLHFFEDDTTGARFGKGSLLAFAFMLAWAFVTLLMPGILAVFILDQVGILNMLKSLKNKVKKG